MRDTLSDLSIRGRKVATEPWTQSRGTGLFTNSLGLLGDNTNFPGLTYDPTRVYGGKASFRSVVGPASATSAELMPVAPDRVYRLTAAMMADPYVGARHYLGVACFDMDGLQIGPQHVLVVAGSTPTTLAADLDPGDTTVVLTNASGWSNDASAGHFRSLRFHPWTSSSGFVYPAYPGGYSRLVYWDLANGMWNPGGISGNTITLRVPWAGPAYAAGTPVVNTQSGSTYQYIAASNVQVPDTWTVYTGTIGGVVNDGSGVATMFPPGTAFVKVLVLTNYAVSGGGINFGGIDFGPDAASEALPAGTIVAYAGVNIPGGWLWAAGQAVSREQYKRLFAAVGTTWGAGNGSTTFNVPDLRSRFVVGAGAPGGGLSTRTFGTYGGTESHVLTEAQLPAHTHAGGLQADSVGLDLGAVADGYIPSVTGSTGGGQAHPHIPPYAAPWYMVKI